ncbi:MAG TPA: hypothetical protein VIE63_07125 [Ramlibacter sp.]|jgi:hypothetical protein
MNSVLRPCSRALIAAAFAAAGSLAQAQAQSFEADYRLEHSQSAGPHFSIAPALPLAGDAPGAGLSLQNGRNWFSQVGVAQGPVSPLVHSGPNDIFNLAGGYRWANGQSLSLQLSRGRGPGQRLGLALNYDWPHYFLRFSYDPQGLTLSPQESLRFSAGVRF